MSVVSGEENIHPTRAPLHHVMPEIWNDHSGDPFVRQLVALTHNSQIAEWYFLLGVLL